MSTQQHDEPETVWADDVDEAIEAGAAFGRRERGWWERGEDRYLNDLWADKGFSFGRKGGRRDLVGRSEALVVAHGMVRSFIQTFADDRRYDVAFSDSTFAGTDYGAKKVVISPAPALDETIDATTAGLILTAMAVHESAHVRYGTRRPAAIKRTFGENHQVAKMLSNLLADLTDERHFVKEFPGYAGVFRPAIKYVAEAYLTKDGRDPLDSPENTAIAAVRYAEHVTFPPEVVAERDWWQAWGERHSRTTSLRAHIEGIREGLEHLREQHEQQQDEEEQQQGQGKGGSDESQQRGNSQQQQGASGKGERGQQQNAPQQPASGTERPEPQQQASQAEEPEQGDDEAAGEQGVQGAQGADAEADTDQASQPEPGDQQATSLPANTMPTGCLTETVENAAVANGVNRQLIDGRLADQILRQALTTAPTKWGRVDHREARQLARRNARPTPVSGSAAAAIRAAFLRSRTGNSGLEKGQPRGRCDNASLYRIALDDRRLFHRRSAPSPARYLVWVMVDRSGSMSGAPTTQTIAVSKALAEASRYVGTMRLSIFGWTDAQGSGAQIAQAGVYRAWSTGEPLEAIEDLHRIGMGGTPDAPSLAWAIEAIKVAARPGEQSIIIMASDGMGNWPDVKNLVQQAAKDGIRVISAALGHMNRGLIEQIYGPKNYVPWRGSIEQTARGLARMLGRIMA